MAISGSCRRQGSHESGRHLEIGFILRRRPTPRFGRGGNEKSITRRVEGSRLEREVIFLAVIR